MSEKDDRKVADVHVREINGGGGWFTDGHEATVTLDDGSSATCTGSSPASAINDAGYKARSSGWKFW
jgi:hypothetical protein